MSATSTMGVGPGESFGLRKPNNSCGPCGGNCGPIQEITPSPKIGCFSSAVVAGCAHPAVGCANMTPCLVVS